MGYVTFLNGRTTWRELAMEEMKNVLGVEKAQGPERVDRVFPDVLGTYLHMKSLPSKPDRPVPGGWIKRPSNKDV